MQLHDILTVKGSTTLTTFPEASLAEAVRQMVEHNIGSLLVCQRHPALGERLVGIVTERDLLPLLRRRPVRPDRADRRRSHDHRVDHG